MKEETTKLENKNLTEWTLEDYIIFFGLNNILEKYCIKKIKLLSFLIFLYKEAEDCFENQSDYAEGVRKKEFQDSLKFNETQENFNFCLNCCKAVWTSNKTSNTKNKKKKKNKKEDIILEDVFFMVQSEKGKKVILKNNLPSFAPTEIALLKNNVTFTGFLKQLVNIFHKKPEDVYPYVVEYFFFKKPTK